MAKAVKDAIKTDPQRTYATNRRARYDYLILETLEVGIVLTGTEIKSVRSGRVNLTEAFGRVDKRELWLFNMHIATYDPGSRNNHEPTRNRKLLAHTREIGKLMRQLTEPGTTLVPLRMYDRAGHVKIELALGRGKHSYDKRQTIAKRDADRQIARAVRVDAH